MSPLRNMRPGEAAGCLLGAVMLLGAYILALAIVGAVHLFLDLWRLL